jgi:hypothetical protein
VPSKLLATATTDAHGSVDQRGIDSVVDVTLQLSAQTLAWLADRPRAGELVVSVWARLAELERAGHHPSVIAALRFVLIHHQPPTPTGRCRTCRRFTWRRLWRRRPFPCVVWRQIHSELGEQLIEAKPSPSPEYNPSRGTVTRPPDNTPSHRRLI